MDVKRLAIATAALVAALSLGVGVADAAPADPPPGPTSPAPPHKAKTCWSGPRVGPGSGRGSAGIPVYPPPCPPGAPH
ncbi:hypothetical protein PT015_04185 [Candidatus Mycobacterium wuenschmannii]|uniref:Uncharacterized protein n=1 Tax=Candidatus Mycobacterium wuenschmannii TaxID=3027808 RepID=A0ABY8VYI4_9MYCO|nr:hypothetical protein [Candidatus Mycobacterium wuenschmannii]WIM88698.1 hypothetical protein PT015_04185 [Candidatus Mycobacterium wuenschmannii]